MLLRYTVMDGAITARIARHILSLIIENDILIIFANIVISNRPIAKTTAIVIMKFKFIPPLKNYNKKLLYSNNRTQQLMLFLFFIENVSDYFTGN